MPKQTRENCPLRAQDLIWIGPEGKPQNLAGIPEEFPM